MAAFDFVCSQNIIPRYVSQREKPHFIPMLPAIYERLRRTHCKTLWLERTGSSWQIVRFLMNKHFLPIVALFALLAVPVAQGASVSPGLRKGVACKFEKLGATQVEQMIPRHRNKPGGPKGKTASCTEWRVTIVPDRFSMVHYKVFNASDVMFFKLKGKLENRPFEHNVEASRGKPIVFTVGVWGKDHPIIGAVAEALDNKKANPKPTPPKPKLPPEKKPKSSTTHPSQVPAPPLGAATVDTKFTFNGVWEGQVSAVTKMPSGQVVNGTATMKYHINGDSITYFINGVNSTVQRIIVAKRTNHVLELELPGPDKFVPGTAILTRTENPSIVKYEAQGSGGGYKVRNQGALRRIGR